MARIFIKFQVTTFRTECFMNSLTNFPHKLYWWQHSLPLTNFIEPNFIILCFTATSLTSSRTLWKLHLKAFKTDKICNKLHGMNIYAHPFNIHLFSRSRSTWIWFTKILIIEVEVSSQSDIKRFNLSETYIRLLTLMTTLHAEKYIKFHESIKKFSWKLYKILGIYFKLIR